MIIIQPINTSRLKNFRRKSPSLFKINKCISVLSTNNRKKTHETKQHMHRKMISALFDDKARSIVMFQFAARLISSCLSNNPPPPSFPQQIISTSAPCLCPAAASGKVSICLLAFFFM
ncbi:hypothetical protein BDD12DRAFT_834620, partial [Trichophaea hybrida]